MSNKNNSDPDEAHTNRDERTSERRRANSDERSFALKAAWHFIHRQPEFGVLFVVLLVWQVLQPRLKDTSEAASFIWFLLLCIGSVSLLRIINFLLRVPAGELGWLKKLFLVTVSMCFLIPLGALAITIALAIFQDNGDAWATGERVSSLAARIFRLKVAGAETRAERPSVAEPPITSQVVPPPDEGRASPYDTCIRNAHKAGKPAEIIKCAELL